MNIILKILILLTVLVNTVKSQTYFQYLRKPIVWETEKELLQTTEFKLLKELVFHIEGKEFKSTRDFLKYYLFPEFIKEYTR